MDGDGCSADCRTIETDYACPTPGMPCMVLYLCGNSMLNLGESCDDGNTDGGDGCDTHCQIEGGWSCPELGRPCQAAACGDGIVAGLEACDDGNTMDGDGCAGDCSHVEMDYTCPTPGVACTLLDLCGDGALNTGEACDDGNRASGDGCDGHCAIESGWRCLTPGAPCDAAACGDSIVAGMEGCDDGNTTDGDGCSSSCAVEPDYACPTPGSPCVVLDLCGNGMLNVGEACDDGNRTGLDGCSAMCATEPGWVCPTPGFDCIAAACGDGLVAGSEACDDGNTVSGDGCPADCSAVETDFACPTPGAPCVSLVMCNDGRIGAGEQCEDGNTTSGDGCDSMCQLEAGWTCPVVGAACRAAACGDGIAVGAEECDDGNTASGDGCSSTCALEDGWVCGTGGGACMMTTCGDGVAQGSEQCDDGNLDIGDGCTPFCEREPDCSGGSCVPVCGDGQIFPGEACDDGNTRDGDGCSSTCALEPGFSCTVVTSDPPPTLDLPIVYRDFRSSHPDFERSVCGNQTGMVETMWGSDRKPVPASPPNCFQSAATYDQWYNDVSGTNITIPDRLILARTGTAGNYTYVFDDSSFFPLDGRGWTPLGEPEPYGHNFHFTSEVRFWFRYDASQSATLSFRGDDDVWVFINGVLAVDIGGIHSATAGSVTVSAGTASTFGLVDGGIYEAAVFQAERHTTQSNYRLQLQNFFAGHTSCTSICGDGIVTPDEVCDDGVNDGSYGGCMPGCAMRAPFCGDGTLQPAHESCDDGFNVGSYDGCAPGCVLGPRCGDGTVQPTHEVCDDGVNDGSYGGCNADCQSRGPRCGDGTVQPAHESCDAGAMNDGSYDGCNPDCYARTALW